MNLKKCLLNIVSFGILVALLSGKAAAALITFTHTGTGSGAIGSTSFSNADFIITAVGDTNNRINFGGGFSIDHNNKALISISGVGTFSFSDKTSTFVNNDNHIVGFNHSLNSDLFNGPIDVVFATWNLDTSIGPITGTGELLQWNDPFHPIVQTSGGDLFFVDAFVPVTFTATVVPIPAAIWLFGSGLLGLIGVSRRSATLIDHHSPTNRK